MIQLNRLGPDADPLFLNHELIATVEAHPDTVVTLSTGAKLLVEEKPGEIAQMVQGWRAQVLADALAAASHERQRSLS